MSIFHIKENKNEKGKHFTGEIHFFCKSTIERKCIWNFKVSTLNYHYLASALRFEAFFHNKNKVPNRALWLLRW